MIHKSVFAKLTAALALGSVLLVAATAQAEEVRPMIKMGYDVGGDKLMTVMFTDGSTQSLYANRGWFIGGGMSIINDAKDIEGEISLSYKSNSITASNGDVSWTRFPIDALLFYRVTNFRVGGGLTYHLSPELSGSGLAAGLNVTADNAMGLMLQADYGLDEKVFVGLRYTSLEYKVSNCTLCAPAKSNGLGLVLSASF